MQRHSDLLDTDTESDTESESESDAEAESTAAVFSFLENNLTCNNVCNGSGNEHGAVPLTFGTAPYCILDPCGWLFGLINVLRKLR